MKTKYIFCGLLLIFCLSLLGQTVYTPWGTEVDVWTPQNDMTLTQRNDMDDSLAAEYPNAEFHPTLPNGNPSDPSSSSMFNCHGYAWYMYWRGENEFDTPWNMHSYEAENYFDDPSYKACSQSEADIWWINSGAHSALATDNQNELKSKWGTGPLATHGTGNDDSPYPISTVTYYKQCAETKSGGIYYDVTLNYCAVKFTNTSVSSYVDLEVEYEDAVLIEGTFTTGTGATLNIHPE